MRGTRALGGAHLRSYRGPESNDVTTGLLLRAATLFDLSLLAPDPVSRRSVKAVDRDSVRGSCRHPTRRVDDCQQRPNQEALELIWQRFQDAERTRNQTTSLEDRWLAIGPDLRNHLSWSRRCQYP